MLVGAVRGRVFLVLRQVPATVGRRRPMRLTLRTVAATNKCVFLYIRLTTHAYKVETLSWMTGDLDV
jgi:hypothetical protein